MSDTMTIRDIRASYTEEKKAVDRMSGLWGYLVMRKLSFYPTWLFIRFGFSANQVSVLGIIFLLVGCLFLLHGGQKNVVIGAIFLNTYLMLDYVDGNVARFTKKSGSKTGMLLERVSAFLDKGLVYACAGVGASLNPNLTLLEKQRWIFAVLGVWTSFMYLITPFAVARFQDAAKVEGQAKYGLAREYKMLSSFPLYRIARETIGGIYLALMLVMAILDYLGFYVIFYALVATAGFFLVILRALINNLSKGKGN